jgi:flagellar P-ring protein FlgI
MITTRIPTILLHLLSATALTIALWSPLHASKVRIKDVTTFHTADEIDLIGYGLVIGLDGSGDGNGTQFTTQSLVNMMQRMGLTIDKEKVKTKNVAAVMVTARVSSDYSKGSAFDVTLSSIGDASSLQGGTLLLTPLSDADGVVRASAQGSVSIGGFNIQVDQTNRIVNNYTLVGRVPNGGKITVPTIQPSKARNDIRLSLLDPDQTTAYRIAERINIEYGNVAVAQNSATVDITIPDSLMYDETRTEFVARVGQMLIIPDGNARVVINEKTGTIVAGQHVTIEPVAIAHGTITVNIQSLPVISQPEPFSQGETVETQENRITVQDEKARVVELAESVYLSDIASALNKIGATPRDIIAIFQALKEAGALRAELVIM